MLQFFDRLLKWERYSNMIPRIISLLLAVTLWAYVSESKEGEVSFKIPVSYKNLPANMTVSFISHKNVIATLQGRNEHLKNLQMKNIQAVVDLKNPRVGSTKKYTIQLQKSDIPEDISVEFDRKSVDAIVEMLVFKKLRVIPRTMGSVDNEYFVGKIKVEPEYILAEGPQSIVESISTINTEDIVLTGAREDILRDVELKKDDLTGLNLSETNVTVVVPITRYGSLHRVDVPVVVRNVDRNYVYKFVDPVVKIYFKSLEKKQFTAEDVDASVDISTLKLNLLMKNRDELELQVPVKIIIKSAMEGKGNVEIVSVVPETVKLHIGRKQ